MDDHSFCPVHEAIQILQEKWTMHIVRALLNGPLGFNELSRASGGCNPATLAQRLDRLEELGVVSRTMEQVMPPRTSYRLTASGVALEDVIEAIDRWGRHYISEPLGDRARAHAACPPLAPAAEAEPAPSQVRTATA